MRLRSFPKEMILLFLSQNLNLNQNQRVGPRWLALESRWTLVGWSLESCWMVFVLFSGVTDLYCPVGAVLKFFQR